VHEARMDVANKTPYEAYLVEQSVAQRYCCRRRRQPQHARSRQPRSAAASRARAYSAASRRLRSYYVARQYARRPIGSPLFQRWAAREQGPLRGRTVQARFILKQRISRVPPPRPTGDTARDEAAGRHRQEALCSARPTRYSEAARHRGLCGRAGRKLVAYHPKRDYCAGGCLRRCRTRQASRSVSRWDLARLKLATGTMRSTKRVHGGRRNFRFRQVIRRKAKRIHRSRLYIRTTRCRTGGRTPQAPARSGGEEIWPRTRRRSDRNDAQVAATKGRDRAAQCGVQLRAAGTGAKGLEMMEQACARRLKRADDAACIWAMPIHIAGQNQKANRSQDRPGQRPARPRWRASGSSHPGARLLSASELPEVPGLGNRTGGLPRYS